jgi:hypothetical protein
MRDVKKSKRNSISLSSMILCLQNSSVAWRKGAEGDFWTEEG